MNSELRQALSDLLENNGREWYQTTSELFQEWFNKLASEGFVDSKSGWLKIAGQDYPAMSYQITEAGLEALGYQSCLECEGTGVDDYDFETKTKTSCLYCQGKGYIPAEPEPPEYDADKAEREHEAALDTIEAERDLKAYRAEHGDDAPDPQNLGFIPPKAGCYKVVLYGNEGEQDLYTVESVWPQHPQGTMYLIERRDSDNLLILHYVLERYLKPGDNPDMAVFDADAFHTEDQLFEQGNAEDYDQLRIERGEFETENYQLKQQLAAVTAERDALKTQMAQIAEMARLFIRKEREHVNSEYLWHEGLLAILTMTGE